MNAKKALKKLKKQAEKMQSASLAQLKQLAPDDHAVGSSKAAWRHEVKGVSEQTLACMVHELATPLNPLLSWFNEGGNVVLPQSGVAIKRQSVTPSTPSASSLGVKTIMHLPLKSPPCKRCPALSNGICKCAAKQLKHPV